MNKTRVAFIVCAPLVLVSGCVVTSDPGYRTSYVYSASRNAEPYWSNHYFDTGYGYHNMGYWGVGSWDIGSFRHDRAL